MSVLCTGVSLVSLRLTLTWEDRWSYFTPCCSGSNILSTAPSWKRSAAPHLNRFPSLCFRLSLMSATAESPGTFWLMRVPCFRSRLPLNTDFARPQCGSLNAEIKPRLPHSRSIHNLNFFFFPCLLLFLIYCLCIRPLSNRLVRINGQIKVQSISWSQAFVLSSHYYDCVRPFKSASNQRKLQ